MNKKYVIVIIVAITGSIALSSIYLSIQTDRDKSGDILGIKHIVPLDKIKNNGVPKDGIPPLNNPKYIQASDADIADEHIVIGVRLNGQTKAYPLYIMLWHEIINEKFGDTPIAVTYCPLCFTSQVFDRRLDGTTLEFGNTGNLYNSNLVMYDKNTNSQWSQALGMAITGEHAGKKLKRIPFDIMHWKNWKEMYPDTLVLSSDTGFNRPYGANPYGDYFTNNKLVSPINNYDTRLHPKEIVVGFYDKNRYTAYLQRDIESGLINDKVGQKEILLLSKYPLMTRIFDRKIDGKTLEFSMINGTIVDIQTSSKWNIEGTAIAGPMKGKNLQRLPFDQGFWFEWSSLHPETTIYHRN